ncbi:MAG: hypothetical protein ACI32N_04110 [Bulleidia sp.]
MEEDREKLFDVPDEAEHMLDEQEFTKALHRMSDTDRHLFENTGVIHIDRDMPAETQTMHVVSLTKKHMEKRNFVFRIILVLLITGVLTGTIGIVLKNTVFSQDRKKDPGYTGQPVNIDADHFPDEAFRSYIRARIDTDQDGILSSQEREGLMIMIVPEDASIVSIQGVELFDNLQSLTLRHTSVTSLDLSSLYELSFLDVSDTQITSLNLQSQEKLVDVRADNTPALTEVYMPGKSMIRSFSTDNSAITCERDDNGYYVGCTLKQP